MLCRYSVFMSHTICSIKHLAWCIFLLLFCRLASAQVNIFSAETMRQMRLDPGWYNSVTLNLTRQTGNTDLLTLKTRFRSDYLTGKYHAFMVADLQQGEKDGKSFTDKGMIHGRVVRFLTERTAAEIFVQKQFNEFILLQDRNLAGGGVRIAPLGEFARSKDNAVFNPYLGIGLMWENERIDEAEAGEVETNIIRSTNYVTWAWQVAERLASATTAYYQFDLERVSDFRVLLESSLGFRLTGKLSLNATLNLRYDNEPPAGVKGNDLEIVNGFSYLF